MAWRTYSTKEDNKVKHNDTCKMAFGNPSSHNDCPRCNELKEGAKPRKAWNADKLEQEARNRAAMAEHFKRGGKHDQIMAAGGVDTAFEW